jgi:hypothetical protein
MTQASVLTPEGPVPRTATRTEPTVSEVRRIPLAALKVDQAVQQRVRGTAKTLVAEYAAAMRGGAAFPPPVVFSEGGDDYHLADGFHRVAAHRSAHPDVQEIQCEVHAGGRDDAVLFACGANASHGQKRSNADKRKAVSALLRSETWSTWSDHEIARRCSVSQPFVGKVRKDLKTFLDAGRREENPPAVTTVVPQVSATDAVSAAPRRPRKARRGGKQISIDTEAIGSGRKTPSPSKNVALLDSLDTAWKLAELPERQTFSRKHYEEIRAYALATGIGPSENPALTGLAPKLPAEDVQAAPADRQLFLL